MKSRNLLLALVSMVVACGGGSEARWARSDGTLEPALVAAFREEAVGDPVKAVDAYLRVLSEAAELPGDPTSVTIAMAALDALVYRNALPSAGTAPGSALADRTDPSALKLAGGTVDERLAKVARDARGPFAPGLIARARLSLAERRGDERAARELRAASGCVREAALVGPLDWANVSAVREPARLDMPVMPNEVSASSKFRPTLTPMRVSAFGCRLPLYAESRLPGVRELAVDLDVKKNGLDRHRLAL